VDNNLNKLLFTPKIKRSVPLPHALMNHLFTTLAKHHESRRE